MPQVIEAPPAETKQRIKERIRQIAHDEGVYLTDQEIEELAASIQSEVGLEGVVKKKLEQKFRSLFSGKS